MAWSRVLGALDRIGFSYQANGVSHTFHPKEGSPLYAQGQRKVTRHAPHGNDAKVNFWYGFLEISSPLQGEPGTKTSVSVLNLSHFPQDIFLFKAMLTLDV